MPQPQHCDGSRKRRQSGNQQKSWWYGVWRSIRFARRFGWPPIVLHYGDCRLVIDR